MKIQSRGLLLFSGRVVSDSLWPHGLQHPRPPCPSPSPGVCPSSLNWRCHLIPSSFVTLFSFCLQSFPASGSFLHQVAKVLGFQLQHQSFNVYSGLISFRMDWLDLLAVQGTLKRLLQHHSPKAPILWCSAFFMVQQSRPYVTTGRTTAPTIWIFVRKVMSLLFNTLLLHCITVITVPGLLRQELFPFLSCYQHDWGHTCLTVSMS